MRRRTRRNAHPIPQPHVLMPLAIGNPDGLQTQPQVLISPAISNPEELQFRSR